jgi:hypothetical protein
MRYKGEIMLPYHKCLVSFITILTIYVITINFNTALALDKAPNNQSGNRSELVTINVKGRGYIVTRMKKRYELAEKIKITDLYDNDILFFQLPIPVSAKIYLESLESESDKVSKIIIQEEMLFENQPD